MKPRLLADENASHRLVSACQHIECWREAGDWDWADRIQYLPKL